MPSEFSPSIPRSMRSSTSSYSIRVSLSCCVKLWSDISASLAVSYPKPMPSRRQPMARGEIWLGSNCDSIRGDETALPTK